MSVIIIPVWRSFATFGGSCAPVGFEPQLNFHGFEPQLDFHGFVFPSLGTSFTVSTVPDMLVMGLLCLMLMLAIAFKAFTNFFP